MNSNSLQRYSKKLEGIRIVDAILVVADKLRFYKEVVREPDYSRMKGTNPTTEDIPEVEKERKINKRFQTATVVKLPEISNTPEFNKLGIEVGNKVIYRVNEITEFDLVKGVDILKPYQVIGVIK